MHGGIETHVLGNSLRHFNIEAGRIHFAVGMGKKLRVGTQANIPAIL